MVSDVYFKYLFLFVIVVVRTQQKQLQPSMKSLIIKSIYYISKYVQNPIEREEVTIYI